MSYMRESACKVCGSMFSKSAGGSVFTVCDDCWYTNADKTEHTRITDLESELKAAHDFRVSFQRELGGQIADQDRKIEALEAENARLREESAARLREIGQWVDASKDIFSADHMFARHKAEAQRDELAEALREIERLAGLAANACDDYDGMGRDPVLGCSLARQAMDAARAALEKL